MEFSSLLDYDNKCFISQNFGPRREFLRQWIQVPLGATYVAMRDGHVVGFGCRRPALQAGNHQVGPLYGDSSELAEALLARLCSDVTGDKVTINIWSVSVFDCERDDGIAVDLSDCRILG